MLTRVNRRFSAGSSGGSAGQAPTPPTSGQEPQAPPPAGAASPDPASKDSKSAEDMERMIAELRKENAQHRTANKELLTYKDQQEASKLSETEKLAKAAQDAKAERETMAAELRGERAQNAVRQAAQKAGIAPDLAAKLVKVEFDADGKPVGVDDAIASLAREHPNLVAAQGDTTSPGNPGRSRAGNQLTLAQLKIMTPQQIAVIPKADLDRALAAG